MRYLILLALILGSGAACAQSYTVSEITNEFASKNIASKGAGLTGSLTQPGGGVDTDEGVAGPVAMNFAFDFFGTSYSHVYVSANGFISFDPLSSAYPSQPSGIPDAGGPNNMIAALWKDLGRQPLSQNSSVVQHYTDIGSALGQWEFRVQWTDWPDQGQTATSAMNTVVVCLYQATGDIEIHFGPLSNSYNFCAGIENATGSEGFAGPKGWVVTAGPNMAYRFSPVTSQALQITSPATLPAGVEGQAYTYNFQASGGTPPYSWYDAFVSGTGLPLPTGWTLDTSGKLSVPAHEAVAGTYTFGVTVSDTTATGLVTQPCTLTINSGVQGLQITTTSPLPNGAAGQAYALQFQASGGTAPYYWADASTAGGGLQPLPAGWTLSVGGTLSAVAQDVVAGTYTFDITVTDSSAAGQQTQQFTVTIDPVGGGGSGGGTTPGLGGSGGGGCSSSGNSFAPWLLLLVAGATLYRRRRA